MENHEVAEFASNVYNQATRLLNGEITLEEFDDGNYVIVFDSEFEHTKLAKNSINYIKRMIASDSIQ